MVLYKHAGGLLKNPDGTLAASKECCCKGGICNYCLDTVNVRQFSLELSGFQTMWCELDTGFGGKNKATYYFEPLNGTYIYERKAWPAGGDDIESCYFELISTTAPAFFNNSNPIDGGQFGNWNYGNRLWNQPPALDADRHQPDRTEYSGSFGFLWGGRGAVDEYDRPGSPSPFSVRATSEWRDCFGPCPTPTDYMLEIYLEIGQFEQPLDCNNFEWRMGGVVDLQENFWQMPMSLPGVGLNPVLGVCLSGPGPDDGRCDLGGLCPSPRWHSAMAEQIVFKSLS